MSHAPSDRDVRPFIILLVRTRDEAAARLRLSDHRVLAKPAFDVLVYY